MTLPIILAAAGCVALLAGLFGGGFKAKEVEVPKITLWPRIFSSLVGLGLVGAAIFAYFYVPSSPVPQPTAIVSPAASPSVPTPAPTPIPDPETFVRFYFNGLWQNRNYDFMWNNYLTPTFQAYAAPKGLQDYTQTWNKIQQIDIDSLNVTTSPQNSAWATAYVVLTFHSKNGTVSGPQSFSYTLTYNSNLATWQFDIR